MADKTIPQLIESEVLENNYAFPMDSGIQSYKVSWATIKQYMWNAVISTFTEMTSIGNNDIIPIQIVGGANDGKIRKVKASVLKSYITEDVVLPIGAVIGFMDFGGVLTYNTARLCPIDGRTISDGASPLNTVQIPDASNRMLLGYGTEAGGDIGSASFSITPVGIAGHVLNLQHDHTTDVAWRMSGGAYGIPYDDTYTLPAVSCGIINPQNSPTYRAVTGATIASSGTTDNTCSTGSATGLRMTSSNSLSSTQSILPRSVKVRWLLRYK